MIPNGVFSYLRVEFRLRLFQSQLLFQSEDGLSLQGVIRIGLAEVKESSGGGRNEPRFRISRPFPGSDVAVILGAEQGRVRGSVSSNLQRMILNKKSFRS